MNQTSQLNIVKPDNLKQTVYLRLCALAVSLILTSCFKFPSPETTQEDEDTTVCECESVCPSNYCDFNIDLPESCYNPSFGPNYSYEVATDEWVESGVLSDYTIKTCNTVDVNTSGHVGIEINSNRINHNFEKIPFACAGGGPATVHYCTARLELNESCSVNAKQLEGVVGFESTSQHHCALHGDGTVSCWGDNVAGQVGIEPDGSSDKASFDYPVTVPNIENAVDITVGINRTCALHQNGMLTCWDMQYAWQLLGVATTLDRVKKLAMGGTHDCAIINDDEVACWGLNTAGQVGEMSDDPIFISEPVGIEITDGVVDLALGYNHSCALRSDGLVMCWGSNVHGQLGEGTRESSHVPVYTSNLSNIVEIEASGDRTCALSEEGGMWCWGAGLDSGQGIDTLVPILWGNVLGDEFIVEMDVGRNSICFLTNLSRLQCQYMSHQSGYPQGLISFTYESGVDLVKQVVARDDSVCAVLHAGSIYCWNYSEGVNTPMPMVLSEEPIEQRADVVVESEGVHLGQTSYSSPLEPCFLFPWGREVELSLYFDNARVDESINCQNKQQVIIEIECP